MTSYDDTTIALFWSNVGPPDANGCRLWLGYRGKPGYGVFKQRGAHRTAWRLTYQGPTKPGAEHYRHSCDNPPCCEPSHIYPGTHTDNMRDRSARGRHPRIGAPHKTVCSNGHRKIGDNIRFNGGRIVCKSCLREANRRFRERHLERCRAYGRASEQKRRARRRAAKEAIRQPGPEWDISDQVTRADFPHTDAA